MSTLERNNLFSDIIDIECFVDNIPFPFITGIDFDHKVDAARVVKVFVGGIESTSLLRIGSNITIKVGTNETNHNLDFQGIITEINPSYNESSFTAFDLVTQLQSSEIVEYKRNDVIGEDLYMLASNACNYKDIDTSELVEGRGILATDDMDLTGLMTRRNFVDKCFRYLVDVRDDNFHKSVVALQWRYAIRRNNIMDFWLEDPTNLTTKPLMTVSDDSNFLIGEGVLANINSSTMVNSATYQSSKDPSLFVTVTDDDSVARHGVYGKVFKLSPSRRDRLEELAYQTVLLHKEPTLTYNIVMNGGEHITLGDYIEVKVPTLGKKEILPVVAVKHTFTDSVSSTITLGNPSLSIAQLIASQE